MGDWRERVRTRLAGLDLDPATEAEVIDELTQHVEDRYRDLLGQGIGERAAWAQAWTELEGHPRLSVEIRQSRSALTRPPVQSYSRGGAAAIRDDLVFAWRRLRHAPGFTAVTLLTVMLTVGANIAILSFADAVLFRPLPYADADSVSIIQMREQKSGQQFTQTPYAFLASIDAGCPDVSEVGVLEPYSGEVRPTIETADGPTTVQAVEVTPNYFTILGVQPARGRVFAEPDAGGERPVALLTYSAWQEIFGGEESIIGKPATFGAATFHVLGVLPRGFVFPSLFANRPSLVVLRKPIAAGEEGGTFHPIVRIARGVSRERAQAEVEAAVASVNAGREWAGSIPVLNDVRTLLYPVGRPIMRFLLAAAGFILLLGCANLANMMLVRGRRDLHDTAVRVALGASRARLVVPMLGEALMVGLGGAALAIAFTTAVFDALVRQVPRVAYGSAEVGVDYRVLLIGLAMGVCCALSFSIVPAWLASGVDVVRLIQRRGGRGSRVRMGRPLIVIQVAIAVAVVFGATIAARAFISILRIPVGFSSEHVIRIVPGRLSTTPPAEYRAGIDRIIETLARRRDVEAVGAAGSTPFSGRAPDDGVRISTGAPLLIGLVNATPGYLEALEMTPVRGRLWTRADARTDPDAAVLSVSAAKRLFAERDPIGGTFDNGRGRRFHVIGVVGDVRHSIDRETAPVGYVLPAAGRGVLTVMVRTRDGSPAALAGIKADVRSAFSGAASSVDWWENAIAANNAYLNPRFQTLVLTGLASLALILTALGIFSVVAYVVAARTREMGVRLAIGASPRSLMRMVIRQALVPVALGVAGGVLLIQWGKALAEAQLFELKTSDPAALAAATATVVFAALVAAYLPARRATRINPTDVLRAE